MHTIRLAVLRICQRFLELAPSRQPDPQAGMRLTAALSQAMDPAAAKRLVAAGLQPSRCARKGDPNE